MDARDMTEEMRRAARRAVDIDVELIGSDWDRPVASRCLDLSPYGMWLETSLPLSPGDEVIVCLTPPHRDKQLTIFSRVRRVEAVDGRTERGAGLEFLDLAWYERKILNDSLRGIPPRFPGKPRHTSGIHPVA